MPSPPPELANLLHSAIERERESDAKPLPSSTPYHPPTPTSLPPAPVCHVPPTPAHQRVTSLPLPPIKESPTRGGEAGVKEGRGPRLSRPSHSRTAGVTDVTLACHVPPAPFIHPLSSPFYPLACHVPPAPCRGCDSRLSRPSRPLSTHYPAPFIHSPVTSLPPPLSTHYPAPFIPSPVTSLPPTSTRVVACPMEKPS